MHSVVEDKANISQGILLTVGPRLNEAEPRQHGSAAVQGPLESCYLPQYPVRNTEYIWTIPYPPSSNKALGSLYLVTRMAALVWQSGRQRRGNWDQELLPPPWELTIQQSRCCGFCHRPRSRKFIRTGSRSLDRSSFPTEPAVRAGRDELEDRRRMPSRHQAKLRRSFRDDLQVITGDFRKRAPPNRAIWLLWCGFDGIPSRCHVQNIYSSTVHARWGLSCCSGAG